MTRFHLAGQSDAKNRYFEAHGDKYIDVNFLLDGAENHPINVRLNHPSDADNPILWVNGIKACEIVGGRVYCKVGGPEWKWDKE